MLTRGDVRRLLAEHGLAPHRSFGQNFVVDANTVRKVVRDAAVQPGDLVVEIGPGLGSLTLALRAAGAEVIAVEIDAGMVRALRDVVGADDGVTIVHADAMDINYADLVGNRHPALVANLPYNASTPLVMTTLRSGVFSRMLLMVQREMGERWTASVGHPLYAAVSVKMSVLADASIVAPVSRNAFFPVPKVDSVTVAVTPRRPEMPVDELFRLVEAGFAQRRKRLRNTLTATGHDAAAIESALNAIGKDPGARPEELTPADWRRLAAALP